jgi:hypothetical protein
VKSLGWSLYDIDRTDAGSLIPFILRFTRQEAKPAGKKTKRVFCDQVNL